MEECTVQYPSLCNQCLRSNGPFVNPFPNKPWSLLFCIICLLKTVGKGDIGRNEQFLIFPQCFLPIWRTFSAIFITLKIVVCNLFQFGTVSKLSFEKGLGYLSISFPGNMSKRITAFFTD